MKFQAEEPSGNDIFDGKGHSNVAKAIEQVLERQKEVHIVGLEGELGSGKSSVIKILQENLRDKDYYFITFDVEQYHHSSIKPSFIKVLSDELLNLCGFDEKKKEIISSARDKALGNILDYTKNTNSQLNWWVAIFAISVLFSVRSLKDGVAFLNSELGLLLNYEITGTSAGEVDFLLGFSPFLILIFMWFLKEFNLGSIPSIGNLLKRNSLDRIIEKLDVTREVGSIEFKDAFKSFASVLPENKNVILVIDNLDRVASDKVKEVWSDLEILTSVNNSSMRVIIPFSERHVAQALSSDHGGSVVGKEFISKRIPVVFTTPPIVSAGWREPFKKYWSETLPDILGVEGCAELIDIWLLPEEHVTPRFLKKHVNDIAAFMASLPNQDMNTICCSAYLLACKRNDVSLSRLLSISSEKKKSEEQRLFQKLQKTQNHLGRYLKEEEWTIQITCIHYQTNLDMAQSEMLGEPISQAINSLDAEKILELSSIYGFDVFFRRSADLIDPHELIKLAAKIAESDGNEKANWLTKWMPDINRREYQKQDSLFEYDEEFVSSMKILQGQKYDFDLSRVKNIISFMDQRVQADNCGDLQQLSETLHHLYSYCSLTNSKPEFLLSASAELYIKALWPDRSIFADWKIEESQFTDGNRTEPILKEIALQIEGASTYGDILAHLVKFNRLGKFNFINSTSPMGSVDFNALDISSEDYALYLYRNDFASLELANNILEKIGSFDHNQAPWLAVLIVQLIACECLSGNINMKQPNGTQAPVNTLKHIEPLISAHPDYKQHLRHFLTYTPLFKNIITQMRDDNVSELIGDSVKQVIVDESVQRLSIDELISDDYIVLRTLFSEEELSILLDWLCAWKSHVKVDFSQWSNQFVLDILQTENKNWLANVISAADSEREFSVSDVDTPEQNLKVFLEWAQTNNKKLRNSSKMSEILENLIEEKEASEQKNYNNSDWINVVMSVLKKQSRNRVIRSLKAKLLVKSISTDVKYSIIRNFSSWIPLPDVSSASEREVLLHLFEQSNDASVLNWFDTQNWNLKKWSKNELENFTNAVSVKSESFELTNLTKALEGKKKK